MLLLGGLLNACVTMPEAEQEAAPEAKKAAQSPALQKEREHQELVARSPIGLGLQVTDAQGEPLAGVDVALVDGRGESELARARSDAQGKVRLTDLPRRNAFVRVQHPEHYQEWIPVALLRPLGELEVDLGAVQLIKKAPHRMRLTFGGDVMFGRRYFDRDEDGILGEDRDLLFVGSVEKDTLALFQYMRGYLTSDDHSSINLETTLLQSELTGHPKNRIVFHSKAKSVGALAPAGVDSVSLGNNHGFDYLEPGVAQTTQTLDQANMLWFGAGMDLTKARLSAKRVEHGELSVAMQGFSDLTGSSHEDPKLRMLATDEPKKAGVLAAWTSELERFASASEFARDFVIPIIHGGEEYVDLPSQRMQDDMEASVGAGADLVIAHHPHVVSGIWHYSKDEHDALVVGSLGNFVFDQLKFETFFSYLVVVDLIKQGEDATIERMSLIPFAIQDFVPRPITSYAAQSLGRKVASLCSEVPSPGKEGWSPTGLKYRQGRYWVQDPQMPTLPAQEPPAPMSVKVPAGLSTPIDVRGTKGDSIAFVSRLSSDVPVSCQFGRDLLMGQGRFEDMDVDGQILEGDHWSWSDYRFVQGHATRHGSGAAALIRHQGQSSRVHFPFRSTVAIHEDFPLTLHGWQRSDLSGKLEVSLRWRAQGGVEQGDEIKELPLAPEKAWSEFSMDLVPAPQSSGLRFGFYLEPNLAKEPSARYLDDISLISWSSQMVQVGPQGVEPEHMQGWEFVRCQAPSSGATLNLSFRH